MPEEQSGQVGSGTSPHAPVREEWLALHEEPALDPERPIIDAHHHLWDRPGARYLQPELLLDISSSGHRVVGTVYVQARSAYRVDGPVELRPVGEVEFALGINREGSASGLPCQVCAGIVGFADLLLGEQVAPVLDALVAAGAGRLSGVRNTTAWHADPAIRSNPQPPPPGLLSTAAFRRGAAQLAPRGLNLDIWAYHTQLDEVLGLARALPKLPVILDHVGGPLGAGPYAGRKAEIREVWMSGMRALAACPNVAVKLGGLAMRVGGFAFDQMLRPPSSQQLAEAWGDILHAAISLFGPQRCMFESNFPVDKGMVGYGPLWNAFKRVARQYSPTEQDALFGGTANRLYGLAIPEFEG